MSTVPLLVTATAAWIAAAYPSSAADLVGQASIIDGDTLDIEGTRIRLAGMDAPDHDQLCADVAGKDYLCGAVATNRLSEFIARWPFRRDESGRTALAAGA